MTDAQFQELKATMPWRHHTFQTTRGQVIVQVLDNKGQEVPIFTMVEFLEVVTAKMTTKKESGDAQQTATNEA